MQQAGQVEVIFHSRPRRQLLRGTGSRRPPGPGVRPGDRGADAVGCTRAQPVTTWLEHAAAYAEVKWPHLAPHSRAQPGRRAGHLYRALTGPTPGRPSARDVAPRRCTATVFNPQRRRWSPVRAGQRQERLGSWREPRCRSGELSDTQVVRAALNALTVRLGGRRAAAATVTRKRAVFRGGAATPSSSACSPPTAGSARCGRPHPQGRHGSEPAGCP